MKGRTTQSSQSGSVTAEKKKHSKEIFKKFYKFSRKFLISRFISRFLISRFILKYFAYNVSKKQ